MKKAIALGLMVAALPISAAYADVSEDRDVDSFHKISVDGLMDVTITVGGEQKVTITANKDRYLEGIEAEVRDGTLYLDMDDDEHDGFFSIFHDVDIEVTITVPSLDSLEKDGLGDVEVHNVDSDDFYLNTDGLGSIKIDGTCGKARMVLDGLGDLKARNFECREIRITLDGMGDASIYASEYADVNLDGFGNIDVYGDPKKTRLNQDGMGDIDIK